MRVIKNRYAGKCAATGRRVAPGQGFAVNRTGKWETYCGNVEMLPGWLVKALAGLSTSTPVAKLLHADGRLEMPYDRDALPLIRSLPGRRWDAARKCNWVSTDVGDLTRVIEVCTKLGVKVADALLAKAATKVDWMVDLDTYKSVSGHVPYAYQVEGIEFLGKRIGKRSMLADDMGLGKTIQVLLSLPKDGARAVVVAPAAVRYNWRDEVAEWRPDLKVTVLEGRTSFRWPAAGEIVITGFSILPALIKNKTTNWEVAVADTKKEALRDHARDILATASNAKDVVLVVDEVHRAKNYKTLQAQRVSCLSDLCGTAWGLTGTPLPNRAMDLFGTFSALGMSREVFGGWRGFVRLFNGCKGRFGGWEFGGPDASVPERLKRVMIRRRKSEVLTDLPDKTYRTVMVPIKGKALLNRMDKINASWTRRDSLPDFSQFSKVRADLAMSRYGTLVDLISDYEDAEEPLVVFSAHKAPMQKLATREGWGLITGDTHPRERQRLVKSFQAGNLVGLACTIIAAGVGLTMTRASTAIFLDLGWTPADNAQAEDRIYRIGQTADKVTIVRLVSDHPMDEHVLELLVDKQNLINASIEDEVLYTPKAPTTVAPLVDDETGRKARAELARDKEERETAIAARLEADLKNANRDKARKRIADKGWTEKLSRRTGRKVVMTEALRTEVLDALQSLSEVCDGALEKDGMGFNKPDSAIGKWLALAGLDDDEVAIAAYHLVFKYKGQLGGGAHYPGIYGEVAA